MIKLFSYKMTDDTGFAPNPFHGFLSLATCKPGIRKTKQEGDWVAGFTSKTLNNDSVVEERLIYLMEVTDKITIAEYWNDKKFSKKKPRLHSKRVEDKCGDNIYKPYGKFFIQTKNCCHDSTKIERDLSGEYVLISNNFYYFGGNPIMLDKSIRPNLQKNSTRYGRKTDDQVLLNELIKFISKQYKRGINSFPTSWPSNKIYKKNKCG